MALLLLYSFFCVQKSIYPNKFSVSLKFVEADVNTATPSLSNAAATWAGWAVTAVTAKFYRSQSDTVKSMNPANRVLTKPASLEQPSSSSISTTTSSVTSMTSLEHEEGSRGNESVSDYDYDHWGDNDNWGDIEVSVSEFKNIEL